MTDVKGICTLKNGKIVCDEDKVQKLLEETGKRYAFLVPAVREEIEGEIHVSPRGIGRWIGGFIRWPEELKDYAIVLTNSRYYLGRKYAKLLGVREE